MRVICLYVVGKYPLHREHLKHLAQSDSVNEIIRILDLWYSTVIPNREVCEALRTADRLINIFLIMVHRNRI